MTTTQEESHPNVAPDKHAAIKKKLTFSAIVVIVLTQTLWAVAIPIKNVAVMPYPKIVADSQTLGYDKYNASRGSSKGVVRTIPGKEAFQVVKDVINLSLNISQLRRFFEGKGDFAFDEIGTFLTTEQHQLFAKFYALAFQASEMLAMGTIKRSQSIYVYRKNKKDYWKMELTCSRHGVIQGMTCTNNHGDICDDGDWGDWTMTNGTGWQNKVSLMGFITAAHTYMRSLFAKKDWSDAYDSYRPWDLSVESDPKSLNHTGFGIISSTVWDNRVMLDWAELNFTKVESCMGLEYAMGSFHAPVFAARLVEQAVINNKLYNAVPVIKIMHPFDDVWEDMFKHDILLTSGAGVQVFENDQKTFVGASMTRSTQSVTNLKLNRPMTGAMIMGNAPRHLEYLTYYRDWFYSYLNVTVEGDTIVSDWRQLGAYYAGFNGFKFDFTHNTMGVFRLSERTKAEGTGYAHDWFEQEKIIAAWYRNHEVNDPNSLITMASALWGTDYTPPSQGYCFEGWYRKLAQVAWIMALRLQPVMSHLVYMSMEDPDPPVTWFAKQMMANAFSGENIGGIRVSFPVTETTVPPVSGSAWPLVPLLNAFREQLGEEALLTVFMSEMNITFLDLIEVEQGDLMFHDAVHCRFGRVSMGVSQLDDKSTAWNKLYPKVREMVNSTIHRVNAIHQQLNNASVPVNIPHEYLNYSKKSNTFKYLGPPVYWTHQPLGVGLLRLSVKTCPSDTDLQQLRDSLVCYNTLETRFLNVSTRCWAEPSSTQEISETIDAQGLRTLRVIMWSLGLVLNLLGAVVSIRFFIKIIKLWFHHRFSDMGFTLALNMDIQGVGLISLDAVVIMAFSCLPLILSYHLPNDSRFMLDQHDKPNAVFAEFMVLLSLTWFVRLGIELAVEVVHLKYYNWWFNLLASRVRVGTLILVLLIRLAFKTDVINYDQGLTKLIVSCVVSVVLGFISVVVSVVFDRENENRKTC
ncbi:TPA: hypothetical protein N0F65_011326 [Lagenidium giganteum]|uniref:Uncharacterized protein n=1 Tax=Lagenidium giganteum TaxID=4803 RepID=A0AAV2YIF3_9STRA|nr:TPA: hypothetical protein N0F65_011326 [Lagenidium giganteum]